MCLLELERVLPQLHEKYAADSDGGLRILAFPSNQFGRQGSIIQKKNEPLEALVTKI